jgi:hypothetical protein
MVSKALDCCVKAQNGRYLDQKYLDKQSDIESGPVNEWGDPPFSKNINEIDDEEDEWE